MEKKTKSQIIALVKRSAEPVTVTLCPSKMYPNPGHPFNMSVAVTLKHEGGEVVHVSNDDPNDTQPLETLLNSFSYYNCTAETGKTIHFYVGGKN